MRPMMRGTKGVSPLIASVLLIAFTMAIAAILTAWISSFTTAQKEKTAVFEEKIQCNYGFIENDMDFAQYNVTEGLFKTRIKNTGTMDIAIGKYQTWYEDAATPSIWAVSNPTTYIISAKSDQNDRILTVNVSGGTLTKIKFIGHGCDGVTATASKPVGGWITGTLSSSDPSYINATRQ